MAVTTDHSRYALSFTTGALLLKEANVVGQAFLDSGDWSAARTAAEQENLLQARTPGSRKRLVRETVTRLQVLSRDELDLLLEGASADRSQLLWAAACRRYQLIGEFAEDVLRDRFLSLAGDVRYEDFDAFWRAKELWHDELSAVTPETYKKLRSVVFRMMLEADLTTADGRIEPTLLSDRVLALLRGRTPSDVRFFPTREAL